MSLTVLAAAGLVDGCRDSNSGDCRCGGSSRRVIFGLFFLDTRDGRCIRRKVVQNFPVRTRRSGFTVNPSYPYKIMYQP